MHTRFQVKWLFSCQILRKLEFSLQIFEKIKQNFMDIRPVGAELYHVDGQMDGRRDRET